MRLTLHRKLLLSHFAAVVLVSGSVGTFSYKVAVDSLFENLQSRLEYSAALLSRTLDPRNLAEIRTAEDVGHPAYREALRLLRDFEASSPDIAYIYVMRREGDHVTFVVDSDTSPQQALPGQEYTPVIPSLLRGFHELAADPEITHDEWGYFLSGYAPLAGSAGTYLVGVDMRADEVHRRFQAIRVAGLVSLAVSLVLAWVLSSLLARRLTRGLNALLTRIGEIDSGTAEGRVVVAGDDEMCDLATAINRMSAHLGEAGPKQEQALAEVEAARSAIEARLIERTRELEEASAALAREAADRNRVEEALGRAASTDSLTGLLNRSAMLQLLAQEVERVRRGTRPFSIVLADVDHFKELNETLGHEAGDQILQQLGVLIGDCVRSQDAVSRWGDDQILLFLPETPLEGAMEVGRKLLVATAECPQLVNRQGVRVTLSMGAATASEAATVNDCVHRATLALARAQAEGHNRIVGAESAPAPA